MRNAPVGEEHRVVMVAQALGGGGSGAGMRDSEESSGPVGRSARADTPSIAVASCSTAIVGEHDVRALQQC
jgi:hypothetical protein